MATDYDQRFNTDDVSSEALEELRAQQLKEQDSAADADEVETVESFELPGADMSGEELSIRAIPKQTDEFTCSGCFLVQHRSRLASEKTGAALCIDCAA